MNANHKAAAEASKTGETVFVVYVPDEGERVYSAKQVKMWQDFVMIEAAYLNGKLVAQ